MNKIFSTILVAMMLLSSTTAFAQALEQPGEIITVQEVCQQKDPNIRVYEITFSGKPKRRTEGVGILALPGISHTRRLSTPSNEGFQSRVRLYVGSLAKEVVVTSRTNEKGRHVVAAAITIENNKPEQWAEVGSEVLHAVRAYYICERIAIALPDCSESVLMQIPTPSNSKLHYYFIPKGSGYEMKFECHKQYGNVRDIVLNLPQPKKFDPPLERKLEALDGVEFAMFLPESNQPTLRVAYKLNGEGDWPKIEDAVIAEIKLHYGGESWTVERAVCTSKK